MVTVVTVTVTVTGDEPKLYKLYKLYKMYRSQPGYRLARPRR